MLKKNGGIPALKARADKMIAEQKKEIEQLKKFTVDDAIAVAAAILHVLPQR